MSKNEAVTPSGIPVFTGNLALLDRSVSALAKSGESIATATSDVHSSFGGLQAFYKAPEADQLFATTKPVADRGASLKSDLTTITSALSTYSDDAYPLVEKLKELKREADAFVVQIKDDDKWREDGDLADENNHRHDEVIETWTAFQAVERACHDKIVALVGGSSLKIDDGSGKKGTYGYDAETLKHAEGLPWGDPVEESKPWYQIHEHAWDFVKGFFVDGVWGTIKGLGTLVGTDGWDSAKQAWSGLGKLATGLAITSTPLGGLFWALPDDKLPSYLRDSRTAMKETGKALVAWDQWGENPSRAAGAVTFNVVTTVFTGGAGGAASGAGKAALAAKALSTVGKVGRFVDPMTYVFKGAGMGLTKIGDVMAGFKGLGTFEVPALPEGVVTLPEGGFKLADGTLHLPEGSAIPDSAFEVPSNSFKLPDGTEIPAGAIDLGDGVVRLPEGMAPPAGSLRIPEGALKLPEGTAALPEGVLKGTDEHGNTVYLDRPGNVLKEDGTLKQHHTAARQETPVSGAATPPAEQPALVGAHTVSNTDSTIRMGDDLGGVGRAGDDLGGGGSRGSDGTNRTPGGSAGDRMPSNSLGGESSSNHTSGNERPPANNPAEGGGSAARQESSSAGDSSYPNASSRSTGGNRLPQAGSPRGSELDGVAHRGDDSAAEHPDSLDQGDAPKPDDDNAVQHGDAPATNPRGGNEPDYSRPAILPADGPLTLRTVRNTSHTRTRWERGEEFHRQMWGGGAERHYPVPTSTGSRYPVTASGGRKVDVPIDMPDGRTVAMEVKTYGPFRTITLKNGTSQTIPNEVPLSKHIREQIHKDIALRRMDPGYDPRWSFTHAGPSDALRAYLKKARIIFLEYGKPPRKN